ncbi:MAG: AAA family ATPase [Thermodesulfobacteriota bacterium]|nr:AAA family ATPase [Thermodesulfobacteriota bacterium]
MDKLVVASTRRNSGKTSVIVGLSKALEKDFAYLKPFGDRLYYRKKRLWDHDSALMTNIFDLKENPEDMSIGFEHSRIRYMYDEETIKEKFFEMISDVENGKDLLFIEGAESLRYGAFVHLDAISLARYTNAKLLIIVSGDERIVMDDLSFLKKFVDMADVDFRGVIINKVQDIEYFKDTYFDSIQEMGINVIGIIPHRHELAYFSVNTLVERLFTKVIAGEGGLDNIVKNIFPGAMSADAALQDPLFEKECKVVVTSGYRSDTIVAALESSTSCIVLTNSILPASNVISKANESNIPLLLVSEDMYQIAKQIENVEPVLTKDDTKKIDLVEQLVKNYVDKEKI